MKIAVVISRFLFGLPIIFFGIFGLIMVMPDPHTFLDQSEGFNEAAKKCLLAMWESKFLMPSVCVFHTLAGLMVIVNRWAALGLAIHLPISLQMVLFHLALSPETGLFAYAIFALNVFLMVQYRVAYSGILNPRLSQASGAKDGVKYNG